MNCKRAILEIALWVGDDLDSSAVEGLQRHLSQCSPCRRHWENLKSSLNRLREPVVSGERSLQDSVWPDLLSRLPARSGDPQPVQFNGWLPAIAVIAASVAIAAFWQNEPTRQSASVAVESSSAPVVVHERTPIVALSAGGLRDGDLFRLTDDRSTIESSNMARLLFQTFVVYEGELPFGAEYGDSRRPPTFWRSSDFDENRHSRRVE